LKAEFGSIVISIYRGGAANAQHVRRRTIKAVPTTEQRAIAAITPNQCL
jgi:hypothetical protein